MWMPRFIMALTLVTGCALLFAEDKTSLKQMAVRDFTKTLRIEVGAKGALANSAPLSRQAQFEAALNAAVRQAADAKEGARLDRTKVDVVELPTKRLVQSGNDASPNPVARTGNTSHTTVESNPKVEPGSVAWHPDFRSACAAAKKSGKPVLLFQMMGNLDDRFC